MKEWEKKLRERAAIELKDKVYDISTDKWVAYTSKQGYIEYLVVLEKELIKQGWKEEKE